MKKLFAVILSLGLIMAPVPALNTAHAAGGGAGGYLKVILGMANGIVGSTIITKCKLASMQPSIMIYFSGSLVYIAAEIMGGKEKRKDTDQNAQNLDQLKANMKEGGDYQRASIEMQIKNEEDNLKHIEKKIKWMNATRAIYLVAATMAFYEWWMSLPPPPAGPGMGKPDIGACSPNPALNTPMTTAISYAYVMAQGYASGGMMGAGLAAASQLASPYVQKLLAQVGVGANLQEMTVTMLNKALGRVAFFGAAAVVVSVLVGELNKEADSSRQKIAQLKAVLNQFSGADNSLAEGSSGANTQAGSANGNLDPAGNKNYALKSLPASQSIGKHCFSSTSQGMNYSEESCKSSLKIARPRFGGQFEIPAITAGANTSVDLAQAISDGDLAKAEVEAGKLSSMAGGIEKAYLDMMKKTNAELKKQGGKPVDVDSEVKRQVSSLENELNKKGLGSSSIGNASSLGSTNVGSASVSGDKVDDKSVGEAAPVTGSSSDKNSLTVGTDSLSDTTVDPNAVSGEGVTDATLQASEDAALSENTKDGTSEINKDSEVSLFKQVSNRYFLNYTKLFERKKLDTQMAPAPQPAQ